MNDANLHAPITWGDRTRLLPKQMLYVLSLDVTAACGGPYLTVLESPPKLIPLRHVFEQTVVTVPEGRRCDIPSGVVLGGDGELGDPHDRASSSLGLRIRTRARESGPTMHFVASGVINFDGGSSVLHMSRDPKRKADEEDIVTGTAFASSCQQASSATFRWLEQRQIFGVGTVVGKRTTGDWVLDFSFDFYAAG